MIQLYCGEGKGKTTAATGAAVRAVGRGRKAIFAQFMKGQESGEIKVLNELAGIRVLRSGEEFPFYTRMTEREKERLTEIHNRILKEILKALERKEADFVVLDEITHGCRFQVLDERLLERILDYGKGEAVEIVLTGRGPSERLLEASDYISEIACIRHPYEKGIRARVGVEL